MNSGLAWQILVVVLKMLFFIQFSVQKLEPFLKGTEGFSLESFRAKGKLLRPDTRALTLVCTFYQSWLKPLSRGPCLQDLLPYTTRPPPFLGGTALKKITNMCLQSLEGLKVSLSCPMTLSLSSSPSRGNHSHQLLLYLCRFTAFLNIYPLKSDE